MVDSTTVTIEFLRARLLSERSVSRRARQRAEELEKRVLELEEQLKIVSDQRKRAEKATAVVLAILGNDELSDLSEEYGSSSDEENYESQIGDGSAKEESSVNSNSRRNKSGELYLSDHDFSQLSGQSLCWKGCRSTSSSPEKYKDSLTQGQRSSGSVGFPQPKHSRGKSCRKIKCRELRVAEELKTNNGGVSAQVKQLNSVDVNATQFEDEAKILSGCTVSGGGEGSIDNSHPNPLKDAKSGTHCDLNLNLHDGERNMEEALQQQAQLIGRYEAMERAQREWEQKFRENNSSTPDSCDLGNHSDVTEERDEIRTNALAVSVTTAVSYQDSKRDQLCICREFSNSVCTSHQPHADVSHMQDHRCSKLTSETVLSKSVSQEATFPTMQYLIVENQQGNGFQPSFEFPCQKSHSISPTCGTRSDGDETSGRQKQPSALFPQETSNQFTGVLDALKQAKLSLQKKVNSLPMVQKGASGQLNEHSVPVMDSPQRLGIPVGCTALFRVPADFDADNSKSNFLGSRDSGSMLNLASYYPDTVAALTSSNQFVTSSTDRQVIDDRYRDSSSRWSGVLHTSSYADFEGFMPMRYSETLPNTSTDDQNFNFHMSRGLYPSSSPYDYNPPAIHSDSNPLQPNISRDGNPTFTTGVAEAYPDRFSFYGNTQFKPDFFK